MVCELNRCKVCDLAGINDDEDEDPRRSSLKMDKSSLVDMASNPIELYVFVEVSFDR